MKKSAFVAIASIAFAVVSIFGFAGPAFADSPGQLSNSPQNYKVRNVTQNGAYGQSTTATCDETVKYSVTLSNSDFGLLSNLTVKAVLANGAISASATNVNNQTTSASGNVAVSLTKGALVYVPGTTVRVSSDGQTRTQLADGVTASGVNAGNLNGSTAIFVQFDAKVSCNTPPPPTQSLSCKDLSLTVVNQEKRQVRATVNGQVTNGATISGYRISFGDNTTVNQQTSDHTYAKDGGYVVVGYVTGTANGKTETVSAAACMKTVAFNAPQPPIPPTPPTPTPVTPETPGTPGTPDVVVGDTIPNTGPEGLVALTAGISGVAAAAHQLYIRRRK